MLKRGQTFDVDDFPVVQSSDGLLGPFFIGGHLDHWAHCVAAWREVAKAGGRITTEGYGDNATVAYSIIQPMDHTGHRHR